SFILLPPQAEQRRVVAEIVSRFDLVAIQEVHQNLHDLKRLMRILGDWWSYIVTDVKPGRSGNQERTAFVFDTRKVTFDGLAGNWCCRKKKRNPCCSGRAVPSSVRSAQDGAASACVACIFFMGPRIPMIRCGSRRSEVSPVYWRGATSTGRTRLMVNRT